MASSPTPPISAESESETCDSPPPLFVQMLQYKRDLSSSSAKSPVALPPFPPPNYVYKSSPLLVVGIPFTPPHDQPLFFFLRTSPPLPYLQTEPDKLHIDAVSPTLSMNRLFVLFHPLQCPTQAFPVGLTSAHSFCFFEFSLLNSRRLIP